MNVCISQIYTLIELIFLMKLILIRQANQESVIFITIGIFQIKALHLNQMYAIDAMIFLMTSMKLSNVAILNIKGSDYCCTISGISKNEAINLIQNADLTEKKWNIINVKKLLPHINMGKKNVWQY